MGDVKNLLSAKFIPTDALVFYKCTNSFGGSYVEHRPIRNGEMTAGAPLEVKVLERIMKVVSKYLRVSTKKVLIHGEIPSNLLYVSTGVDSYRLIWYRKPERRMMYFVDSANIPNGYMDIPGLVYVTDGGHLEVFAFKGSKPRRWLYNAPFYNVNDGGSVCLGTAKVQKPSSNTYEQWMHYWEEMFWKSEFSHILGSNPIKGNLALITKECITENKPFPTDVLTKSHKTLQRLYEL